MLATQDTVRWGDRTEITWNNGTVTTLANAGQRSATKQLVNAHWHWPLSWQLNIILVPQFAADETASYLVAMRVQLGSGSGLTSFRLFETIAPTASGAYLDLFDDKPVFAARDVQIAFDSITLLGEGGITAALDVLEIGAYVAPVTEPHATFGALEHLERLNPQYQSPEMERWMGERGGQTFQEQALYYDPARKR